MKRGWRDAFERLEPPPGGAARLRERLEEKGGRARRTRPVWGGLAAAAAVGLVAVLLWHVAAPDVRSDRVPGPGPDEAPPSVVSASEPLVPANDNPLLVSAGILSAPTEAVTLRESTSGDTALVRVDVSDPAVDFYLVAVAPAE